MKVSAFNPSDARTNSNVSSRVGASKHWAPMTDQALSTKHQAPFLPWPVAVVAVAYFAAHLLFLAPSLEDIDSINFAMALRDFDPAKHQPHPPGYPVYVGLGRVALAVITAVSPSMEATRAEALALSIWSALGGAIAIVAAWLVFCALDRYRLDRVAGQVEPGRASGEAERSWAGSPLWAALLLAVAPLFWMTGLRPMSDMPGLAVTLTAQALLLSAIQGRGSLVPAALITGLAVGLRSQSVVLTFPLLVLALAFVAKRKSGWPTLVRSVAALVVGGMLWAVPLIAASGGVEGYIRALGSQAGEDFGWVNMLWMNPTPRRLAFALYETFVLPWASAPLAVVIGLLALLGAGIMLVRERRGLALLCVAFGPYLVFHLLFQETPFVRYALPLVPAIVWLAACSIRERPRLGWPIGIALPLYAAFAGIPAGIAYGSEPHPAFRVLGDLESALGRGSGIGDRGSGIGDRGSGIGDRGSGIGDRGSGIGDRGPGRANSARAAAVYSHYSLYRPVQARPVGSIKVVPPVRNYEWLGPVEYWRTGGEAQLWFLGDPRRTDLALIDPQSRRNRVQYRWSVANRPELGGTRPLGVDWYRLDPPGWFAGEGWSLTAETGGIVRATARGLDHGPIEAHVRRRAEPVSLMIGGRHLGGPSDPATVLTLSLDGAPVDSWTFDPPATGLNFLRFLQLPDGIPAGPGRYARLTVAARAAVEGKPTPEVAIRQFDVQSPDKPILGFGEGWHEDEYEVSTGQEWRWTSDRSVLRIVSERPVVLIMRGESPLKYFDAPPTVRFRAGDRVIGEFRPEADFEWRVRIPPEVLASANGAIVIETDRVYLPGQAEGTADTRRLSLRIFDCRVESASQ